MATGRCSPVRAQGAGVLLLAILVGIVVRAPTMAVGCICGGLLVGSRLLPTFFASHAATVIIATPQRVIRNAPGTIRGRTYALTGGPYPTNTTVYKGKPGAPPPTRVIAMGRGCSRSRLTVGVPTLFALSDDGRISNVCSYFPPAAGLTAGEVAFLRRRRVDGRCAARNGVPCATPPCAGARQPCGAVGAAVCVNNYCGGCTAEWLRTSGGPLWCGPSPHAWGGWFPTPTPTPRRRYGG